MDKLKKYLLNEYIPIFFSLFFIISIIISLIYIITISNITAKFQITFLDLLKFYILSMPQILLITLSISFFISANSLYSKLSETQELVAMFSLGFKPLKVLQPIIIIGIILSILNLFIVFISIPYAKMAFDNLKNEKQQEAKFNFQSAQISQQFGKWSVFALNKKKEYSNIYLFNPEEKKFITASKASLDTKEGILNFSLQNGQVYDLNKTYIIEFKKLLLNKKIPHIKVSIFNFKNYFKYNKKAFAKYLPIALIPIALIFFIPVISFFHPRLQKNHTLFYSISLLAIYITIALSNKNFGIAIIIPVIFFILGGIFYKWKVNF
jgi:lipopolysaccharide export system permease protein